MNRYLVFVSLIATLAAAGCNDTSSGANDQVLYTPDRCDIVGSGCSFDDSIAVGGNLIVHITGNEGVSTAGFDLESDDLAVLAVESIPDIGGRPTWELTATGPGVARLYAVDANGSDVDFLEVSTQDIDNLMMINSIGDATGGAVNDPDYDEVWQFFAEEETWFYVVPRAGSGELMGVVEYSPVIDGVLDDSLGEGSDVVGGFYKFNVADADADASYELSLTADNGTPLDVLFDVLPAQTTAQ